MVLVGYKFGVLRMSLVGMWWREEQGLCTAGWLYALLCRASGCGHRRAVSSATSRTPDSPHGSPKCALAEGASCS